MKNKKTSNDAIELSRYISDFLNDYAPSHLTNSDHTVKSYETALTLYVGYLEGKHGITPDKFSQECFDQIHIEGWLKWLADERGCSAVTCNNRPPAPFRSVFAPHTHFPQEYFQTASVFEPLPSLL